MERGGIKILPIATKDVRNELPAHFTTLKRRPWLVLQLILADGMPLRGAAVVVLASSTVSLSSWQHESGFKKRFLRMLSISLCNRRERKSVIVCTHRSPHPAACSYSDTDFDSRWRVL
jgi:hypothetical protein